MQDNHWAELLTKTPGRTVARYKPSSPRARVGGPPVASAARDQSSLGSQRTTSTVPTSASGRSSSISDATHNDQRRGGDSALHGQTRIEHLTRSASLGSEDSLSAAHVLKNELQSSTSSGGEASRFAQKQRSHVTRQPTALGHAQEPQADTSHQRTMRLKAHHATSTQTGKTSHIFCGNNILSPKLRRNGGDMEIGSPSQCFRKGFGAGFYQEIEPAHLEEFLADNSGPYRKYIEQPLFYGDGHVPAGKIRATLSQCRSRGFGVGAMQRAKKILKERKHGMSKAR